MAVRRTFDPPIWRDDGGGGQSLVVGGRTTFMRKTPAPPQTNKQKQIKRVLLRSGVNRSSYFPHPGRQLACAPGASPSGREATSRPQAPAGRSPTSDSEVPGVQILLLPTPQEEAPGSLAQENEHEAALAQGFLFFLRGFWSQVRQPVHCGALEVRST